MQGMYLEVMGRFPIPEKVRPELRRYLLKAGITTEPYAFFGGLFVFSVLASFVLYFLFFYSLLQTIRQDLSGFLGVIVQGLGAFIGFACLMFAIIGIIIVTIYAYLDIKIYNRTRRLEEILPEFLETVSSNLKGGMSFEKSLWMSIRPKFGILGSEIALAAKKVMTGHDVDMALTEFSMKYDSPMLRRSMNLIISQIQSGGEISAIIDRIVADLKKTHELKEEMSASVLSYMIFISAIVIFISPVLYSLSYALLTIISSITSLLATSLGSASAVSLPFDLGGESINPDDFVWPFSFLAITITSFGSSVIVSIIEKGSFKGGIKYIPMFLISSIVVYSIALRVMSYAASLISFQ